MRRLGILLILAGCGGQVAYAAFEETSAASLQTQANRLVQQQSPSAILTEIQGNGIKEDGTLAPGGSWRYRYAGPQGGFEVCLNSNGRIFRQRLRGAFQGKISHYNIDSPEAIRRMRPNHFPTKLSLIASGSCPYWILEGKRLSAGD